MAWADDYAAELVPPGSYYTFDHRAVRKIIDRALEEAAERLVYLPSALHDTSGLFEAADKIRAMMSDAKPG